MRHLEPGLGEMGVHLAPPALREVSCLQQEVARAGVRCVGRQDGRDAVMPRPVIKDCHSGIPGLVSKRWIALKAPVGQRGAVCIHYASADKSAKPELVGGLCQRGGAAVVVDDGRRAG